MVFPVVMYRCECWTIKKAEHWRTDAFGLWCWRKLLRAPWTTRRSNQSILKEGNLEYSLEGLMLKLQSFSYLMQRANLLEKILMLGKIEGRRRRGWQRTRQLDGIIDPMDIQDWFPFGLTSLISLLSKGLSRVFSSTTVWKHQFFSAQLSLWSNFYIRSWLLEKP